MSRKKRLLKKTKHTKTYDTETGPVTEMEGVTVTPDGMGIGLPATSDDMIPEGAELSDAERHELEGKRGAAYMNAALGRVSSWMAPMFIGGMPGVGPAFNIIMGAKLLSDDTGVTGAFLAYAKGFGDYWKQNPNENMVSRIWNADDAGGKQSKKDQSNIFYRVSNIWNKDKTEAVGLAVDGVVNLATILPVVGGMFRGVKYRGLSKTPLMLEGPLSKKASSNLFLEDPKNIRQTNLDVRSLDRNGQITRPIVLDLGKEKTHANILEEVENHVNTPEIKVLNKHVNGLRSDSPQYIQLSKDLLANLKNRIGQNGIILDATRYAGDTVIPTTTTITTTRNKLQDLLKSFNISDINTTEFIDRQTGQKIKLNIIDDTGKVIHDMYSFAFPRKYRKFANKFKNKELLKEHPETNLGETMNLSLGMTADELFDLYLNNLKLLNEYSTYQMGLNPQNISISESGEEVSLLWKNYIVNTPWYNTALSRKKVLLTGDDFIPWVLVKQTQRMPELAKILGYPYSLKTSPYARKNIHDMTELFLTTPYRVIRPLKGVPFDEKFISSALGTNVTGDVMHAEDVFGNSLSGAMKTGVSGNFAASVPIRIKGISDVKKLLNILQEKGFSDGAYNKFLQYSKRLQEAKENGDFNEIQKICLEADKFAEESGLYVKLGREYGYNQDEMTPRFLGLTRKGQYSLPVLLGKSWGHEKIPMFGTLSYPLFFSGKQFLFPLVEGNFVNKYYLGKKLASYNDLLSMQRARRLVAEDAFRTFNDLKLNQLSYYNPDSKRGFMNFTHHYSPLDEHELSTIRAKKPKLEINFTQPDTFKDIPIKTDNKNVYGVSIENFLASSSKYKKYILKTGKKYINDYFNKNKNEFFDSIKEMYPQLIDDDINSIIEILKNNYIKQRKTPELRYDYEYGRKINKSIDIDDLKKLIEIAVKTYLYKDFGK